MTTTNHVRLECTNFLTRRCCALCSGSIEKDAVLAVGGGDGSPTFYVCEGCLNVGPAGIQHRMREHADQLEAQARELREAAEESWVLPSHSEWSAANDSADRLFENPSEPHDWCQRPSCRSGALE